MGTIPDTSRGEQDIDSLGVYMRGLNELGEYSAEQQGRLCRSFQEVSDRLREVICTFGFVPQEYLRIIDNILENGAEIADAFLVSSLKAMGDSRREQFGNLRVWRSEISDAIEQLNGEFVSGRDCSLVRVKLAEVMMRYKLTLQQIYILLDVGCNYLRMIDKTFEWGRELRLPEEGDFTFIEQKFLHRCSELPDKAQVLSGAIENLQQVRNELIEANLKLVVSIARRYCSQKLLLGDLIQEGNLGLMRALERIDFSLGYRFSTYASWWIRHRILRAVNCTARVIRMPMHMIKLINDINLAEQRFIQLHDREPEIDELARMLELPVARVSAVRKMVVQTVSLQSHVSNGDDSAELGDFIADSTSRSPEAELNRKVLTERLQLMLETLPEREQQLLIMRFGLFGQPVFTLAEISAHFKLTRERIRQIELRLLAKLRTPEKLKFIDGSVDFDDF